MQTVYYGPMKGFSIIMMYPLDDAGKKLAVRFTARGKTVSRVHMFFAELSSPPTYRIGLQEDVGGVPSGVWLGYVDITPTSSWVSAALNANIGLEESKHYHLVIEYKSGVIDTAHYARPRMDSHPPLYLYPDQFEDCDYRTLWSTDGGVTWSSINCETGWLLEFTDGTCYGQPYIDTDRDHIYGDFCFGMKFQPEARKIVSEVEFQIIKEGSPPNDLDVVLYNITDGVEEARTTIAAVDVPTTYTWKKWTFASPITLLPTKTYRLYMKTTGGDVSNSYGWTYIATFGGDFYSDATWGGRTNCKEKSNDGGSTWIDYTYGDRPFRFTVMFNPALKTAPNGGL